MKGFKELIEPKETEDVEEEGDDMNEEEIYKPCLFLSSKEYPEVSKMKLGDKVIKEFRVKSRTTSDTKEGQIVSVDLELI